MGETRENVKKNLNYYLTIKKISQKDLADKIGVSQSAVTNWVKGKNSPDIEAVAQICNVFDISVTDLFGGADNQYNTYLTPHQQQVITAYINHPEMQPAIDKILGVKQDMAEIAAKVEQMRIKPNEDSIKIAAYGGGVREEKVSADKIQEAKKMAMEILERKRKEKEGE